MTTGQCRLSGQDQKTLLVLRLTGFDPSLPFDNQFCRDAQLCLLVGFVLVGSPNVLRTIVWLAQIRQSSTRTTKATLEAHGCKLGLGTQVAPG